MSGFYLMHRGWMDNPAFGGAREPFCRRSAWAWLIENAAFKEARVPVGKGINLKRGQLCHSLRFLAKAWGWDDPKVRRFLARLVEEKMIDCVADAGQTVITICNYEEYQAVERVTDAPTDAAATQQRRSADAKKNEGNKLSELPDGSSSGADAPPIAPPIDLKAVVFGPVRAWLEASSGRAERQVRSWLGRCCGTFGEGLVIEAAYRLMSGPAPIDPFSALKAELDRKERLNGKTPNRAADDRSRGLAEGLAGALMALGVESNGSAAGDARTDIAGAGCDGLVIDAV